MPTSKSRKKKPPKRVLALPDIEHAKTAVTEQPDICQRPADLRSRNSRVCGLVLFGAPARLQSHRSAPDFGFTWNNADMRRRRSIFGWRPFAASRTKRPTRVS